MKQSKIKKLILILFLATTISAQNKKSLNSIFKNALISDLTDNIKRENPIKVIAFDEEKNRIKTNYTNLHNLFVKGTDNQSWFITQSEEASTVVEIKHVDINTGWITLGKTHSGFFNMDDGETLEFFNPFINYKIINNKPLFDPYPTYINDEKINYIQAGGIIERAKNDYILLTPIVFGAHKKRAIYYATSKNLELWDFQAKKLIGSEDISFAKTDGNVFSSGNPLRLKNGNYIIMLGVEKPNNEYTSAYMIIDTNLKIVEQPKEIKIADWNATNQFPLSIINHNNVYRILFHKRHKNSLETEVIEVITKDIIEAFNNGSNIISSNIIQKAKKESGYLKGKADDASYFIYNSELYLFLGCEETPSEYLTSLNREYGLLKLEINKWILDKRSPLIVNPINLYNKYPEYEWASDHIGGFISPIQKGNELYIFLTFGTDNPDYLLSGIKIKMD